MKILYTLLLSLMVTSMSSCQELRKVTCTLLNEDGTPVEGANVHVGYVGHTSKTSKSVKGLSNPLGVFVATGHAPLRMRVMVDKDGYYPSVVKKLSRFKDHNMTITLRQKKNPIPLYAKNYRGCVPTPKKPCGFDFEIGDWVAPHGTGKKIMCYFEMNVDITSSNEHTQKLTISFPSENDGLITIKETKGADSSEFKWPHEAPEVGYNHNDVNFIQKRTVNEGLLAEAGKSNYALRVNTITDGVGNIVSANYVRINKGLSFFGILSKSPGFQITYYYNPTSNNRNMEFDKSQNLFKDLDGSERVREP